MVVDFLACLAGGELDALNAKVDVALHPTFDSGAERDLVVQNNHITYDELGRMASVADGRYLVLFNYDKNGNRTEVDTSYIDVFNVYDKMNRQTIVNAELDGSYSGPPLTYSR